MSRHGFHSFTSAAPVFGADEDSHDPFYQADRAAPLPDLLDVPPSGESLPCSLRGRAPGFDADPALMNHACEGSRGPTGFDPGERKEG